MHMCAVSNVGSNCFQHDNDDFLVSDTRILEKKNFRVAPPW